MKFLYVRLIYIPTWANPDVWKRFGATWYKCYPFVLMVAWADLETAAMWDL